ncbi:MAG: RNB domain-containing ribonuclease [Thermoplasmatota archaeon]
MKTGDLVEFRSGLFGIEAPKNVGIYLEREKRGKQFFAVLWTTKGRKEILTDHLKGVRISARLEETTEEALQSRLAQLLEEVAGQPKGKPVSQPGEITDRDLWRFANARTEAQTPQEIADAYFRHVATRHEMETVRNVLAGCARPGVGYFARDPGREERWIALPSLAYKDVRQEIEGFLALRKKLVVTEEVEEPDGRLRTVFRGVPLSNWALDEADRRRLSVLADHMEAFVLHDRDTGQIGIPNGAGFLVHTLDGFRLHDFARWLALDWTGNRSVTLSSTFVEFLVDAGVWSLEKAIRTVAQRAVLQKPDFAWDVPSEALRAAERCAIPAAELTRRKDLRALPTWTIDPVDAKDHDDAVSLERHPDGRTTLWVHIADVSFFVDKGSTLDYHARKRATSVYLPTGVLPMLPPKLSDDLCSLNAGQDKLAMSAELVYDAAGVLLEERFHEAVVKVEGNVAYEEVDEAIARGAEPFASMEAFAQLLDGRRRGLALETSEVRVRVGDVIQHSIKQGTRATKMIEVFMVAANEAVARALNRANLACLYRCHPLPDRVAVERFNRQCETMGAPLAIHLPPPSPADGPSAGGTPSAMPGPEVGPASGAGGPSILDLLRGGKMELRSGGFVPTAPSASAAADPAGGQGSAPIVPPKPMIRGLAQLTPAEQEAWLAPFHEALAKVEALPDRRFRELVFLKTLSCMGRAFYTPANLGHFGLGSTCYCHFTSPIRRYPDLVVHRQLRWMLQNPGGDIAQAPHGADLEGLAGHTSDQGAAAEELERTVVAATLVFYSRNTNFGGIVDGLVNGVTRGGLFLALPDGLEARVASADIPGGPWNVDDADSFIFRESPPEDVAAGLSEWRDDLGASVFIRARLGSHLPVVLAGRDFVEGRIAAKLANAE